MNYEELKKLRKKINNNIFITKYIDKVSLLVGFSFIVNTVTVSGLGAGILTLIVGQIASGIIGKKFNIEKNRDNYCLNFTDEYIKLEKDAINKNLIEDKKYYNLGRKKVISGIIETFIFLLLTVISFVVIGTMTNYSNLYFLIGSIVGSIPLAIAEVNIKETIDEITIINLIGRKIADYQQNQPTQRLNTASISKDKDSQRNLSKNSRIKQSISRTNQIEELKRLRDDLTSTDVSDTKPKIKGRH